jgi:hypothetical protein
MSGDQQPSFFGSGLPSRGDQVEPTVASGSEPLSAFASAYADEPAVQAAARPAVEPRPRLEPLFGLAVELDTTKGENTRRKSTSRIIVTALIYLVIAALLAAAAILTIGSIQATNASAVNIPAAKSLVVPVVRPELCAALDTFVAAGGNPIISRAISPELLAATETLTRIDTPSQAAYQAYVGFLTEPLGTTSITDGQALMLDFAHAYLDDREDCAAVAAAIQR